MRLPEGCYLALGATHLVSANRAAVKAIDKTAIATRGAASTRRSLFIDDHRLCLGDAFG